MILSGLFAWWIIRDGIETFENTVTKASFTAPVSVFNVVWGILYVLMGVSLARIRIAPISGEKAQGTNYFVMQLTLNLFWGQVFFVSRCFGLAFLWLAVMLVAVVMMIRDFCRTDRIAAYLQIPYFIWSIYAAYLNCSVWILNS